MRRVSPSFHVPGWCLVVVGRHILNHIVQRGLDEVPLVACPVYDTLNNTLHGRVAAGALRSAVESAADGDRLKLDACLRALACSGLRSVQLSFRDCPQFTDAMAERVAKALPTTLERLTLLCDLKALPNEALGRLTQLRRLVLRDCENLEALPDTLCQLGALTLDLTGCARLGSESVLRLIEAKKALRGSDHPDVATAYNGLALLLKTQARVRWRVCCPCPRFVPRLSGNKERRAVTRICEQPSSTLSFFSSTPRRT